MKRKPKPRVTYPLRPVGDGFVYVPTKDDSGAAFRERMAARVAAAKAKPDELQNVAPIRRRKA